MIHRIEGVMRNEKESVAQARTATEKAYELSWSVAGCPRRDGWRKTAVLRRLQKGRDFFPQSGDPNNLKRERVTNVAVINHITKLLQTRNLSVFVFLSVLMPVVGCDSATPARTEQPASVASQDGKMDLPGPKPDPRRDEAAELIKVCGVPTSDTQKSVEGGTERILSFHRYGIDVFFLRNSTDSPKWASTAVFAGEDNIDRKALSRKMPCSKKVKLHSVDVLDPYMLGH